MKNYLTQFKNEIKVIFVRHVIHSRHYRVNKRRVATLTQYSRTRAQSPIENSCEFCIIFWGCPPAYSFLKISEFKNNIN